MEVSNLKKKEAALAIMRQKCNLLDKELKQEQLKETVERLDEDIRIIKQRISDLEAGTIQGEE